MEASFTCSQCARMGLWSKAEWNVWPDARQTGYDFLCTEHASAALYVGMEVGNPEGPGYVRSRVYQITRIRSTKDAPPVNFPGGAKSARKGGG